MMSSLLDFLGTALAEGVGFEPTILSYAGFQDRCTRPLCEPSEGKVTRNLRWRKILRVKPVAPTTAR